MKSSQQTVPSTAGAASASPSTPAAAQAAYIVLLSADPVLIELLQETAGQHQLCHAKNAAHAADLLVSAGTAVLLLDASLADEDPHALVLRISQQLPDVAIIVAGRREDESLLSKLISEGQIFRFLHKPASADRIRNFIDATLRRQHERRDQQEAGTDFIQTLRMTRIQLPQMARDAGRSWRLPRGLVVAVVVAGLAALLATTQPWRQPEAPLAVRTAGDSVKAADTGDPAVVQLLDAAGVALSQGRLVAPPERNAADLYRSALQLDPGNRLAAQGIDRISSRLFETAEQALMAGDLTLLATTLEAAQKVSPEHPRLVFLASQLQREHEWAEAQKAQARSVALAAGNAAERAASPPRPTADRVEGLVLLARERITNNRLAGNSDSAQAYLLAARRLDATNPGVQQGLAALSARLQLNAREALNQGRRDDAAEWLDHLVTLGVDPTETAALRSDIEAARLASQREERARLLLLANQRIAQGRLLEPQADSARHYLDLLRAADPAFPGLAETAALLAEKTLAEGRRQAPAGQFAAAQSPPAAASGAAGTALPVIAETRLRRTKFFAPQYPERALARGIEGWVELQFTVGQDGRPRDLTVTSANPASVFDQAALEAVGRWRYEPQPADQRVATRLQFELKN